MLSSYGDCRALSHVEFHEIIIVFFCRLRATHATKQLKRTQLIIAFCIAYVYS